MIKKHPDIEFAVGNLVMLSMHNLCMHDNCKFAANFIVPYKVLKHIGKLAYRIELPPLYFALYNVFYVSKLKLYVPGGSDGTTTNVQPVLVDSVEQYEVENIMAERSHSNHKQCLAHWVGYSAEHDLWLPESELTQAPDVLAAWS